MQTPKVDRVAPLKVLSFQRRHSDDLSPEVGQGFAQADKIARIGEDCKVNIAAKLGRAV